MQGPNKTPGTPRVPRRFTRGWQIVLVLAGSFLFQMVLAFTLAIGVDPNFLKLVTALFVLLIVALPRMSGQLSGGLSNNYKK